MSDNLHLAHSIFQKKGLKPEDVHIIGHSLGSHTAGYAGSATKNLGRITGQDKDLSHFIFKDRFWCVRTRVLKCKTKLE